MSFFFNAAFENHAACVIIRIIHLIRSAWIKIICSVAEKTFSTVHFLNKLSRFSKCVRLYVFVLF